jgi:uncharacterized protein (TIGR02996 family)
MTAEDGFLITIRGAPADDATRLVYADWLEEQGDAESLAKAAYLRAECRLAGLGDRDRDEVVLQLREIAEGIPTVWKAAVAKVSLENCAAAFRFVCPRRWDQLREMGYPYVRSCSACRRNVYFCASIEEARERAGADACVAIDLRVNREPGDLEVEDHLTLGELAIGEDEGDLEGFVEEEIEVDSEDFDPWDPDLIDVDFGEDEEPS